jgi:hypothetical protein
VLPLGVRNQHTVELDSSPGLNYNPGRESEATDMQMIKIQIPDKTESAKAMVEMGRRGRVICLPDDVYIVPDPALALLKLLGITFQELVSHPAEIR